jgi:hypothetical protein
VSYVFVFLCGAFYEAGCVFWVTYAARGSAWRAALFSMFSAAVTVAGLVETVRDLRHAPFLVAGYGAGTLVAVRWVRGPKDS